MIFNNKQDLNFLLEHFLIDESNIKDRNRLRLLDENEKREISKEMINAITLMTIKKAKDNDYELVNNSAGDITKFEGYKNMKESIKFLRVISQKSGFDCSEISTVELAIQNIEKCKPEFITGFRTNNLITISLYNNLVTACVCSLSFLIATTIDYTKDITGNIVMSSKSIHTHKGYPTLFFKNLDVFNKKMASGDFTRFFNTVENREKFTANFYLLSLVSIGVVMTIIPMMREIVYQYFHTRIKMADYLRMQSNFILMNQKNLDLNSNTFKKQENIAKEMLKWADKIDVEEKTSSKKAEMEIRRENSSMSIDSPSIENNFIL